MSKQKPSIQDFAAGIAEVVKLTLTQPEPQAPQTLLPADPRLVAAMDEIDRLTAERQERQRLAESALDDRDRALALVRRARVALIESTSNAEQAFLVLGEIDAFLGEEDR